MDETKQRRIILLGKSGSGKSSLANTIFGVKWDQNGPFEPGDSSVSTTKECVYDEKEINGKTVLLFDTPGFFGTDQTSTPEIKKSLEKCAPGPHAFLLVLKVDKFTKQEEDVVNKMLKYFSEEALKYTTLVFTHGDQLRTGKKIEDWASENKALKSLMDKCGGRVHVFDNKYWNDSQDPGFWYRNNQYQVEQLLNTIDQTVEKNGGRCYTNGFWQRLKYIKILDIPLPVLLGLTLGGLVAAVGGGAAWAAGATTKEMDPLKIVLLGKVGAGKSSTANTIFGGENIFTVHHTSSSSSKDLWTIFSCKSHDRNIQLFDTPGVFDSDSSSIEPGPDFCKRIQEFKPHAFLLVLKTETFTQQEQTVVDVVLKPLGEEALKYVTVAFTHGDRLPESMTIEEWVHQNKALNSLVQKCGGRCHVFDNIRWNYSSHHYRNNQVQVKELLKTVEETVQRNGGGFCITESLPPKSFFQWLFGY